MCLGETDAFTPFQHLVRMCGLINSLGGFKSNLNASWMDIHVAFLRSDGYPILPRCRKCKCGQNGCCGKGLVAVILLMMCM